MSILNSYLDKLFTKNNFTKTFSMTGIKLIIKKYNFIFKNKKIYI